MKGKKLMCVSLLILIAIISASSIAAADISETDVYSDSITDNTIAIDDNIDNQNILDTNDNNNENDNNENLISTGEENADETTIGSSDSSSDILQTTYEIDGSATNQMSEPTIQTAINNANPGDIINITGTQYEHCHFVIDKNLTIMSEVGTRMTVCPGNTQGSGSHGIFYIGPQASGTKIIGFTLDVDGEYGILIRKANDVEIINCTVSCHDDGIGIENSQNTIIINSNITNSGNGINIINGTNISILENNIKSNTKGIKLDSGDGITIANNTYSSNSEAPVILSGNLNKITINESNEEDGEESEDDYGVLINSLDNIQIANSTIKPNEGDGIRIKNAKNTLIKDSIINDSNIGINLLNTTNTSIINNNISQNTITGINVGPDNANITIYLNNITYNKRSGIDILSAEYVYISNNLIGFNQNNAGSGSGIYVNCNITKLEITGNLIRQNGQYGVLNDYRVRNIEGENGNRLEIINNNYFFGHSERIAYTIKYYPNTESEVGNFYYNSENDTYTLVETGGTHYLHKTVIFLGYAFFKNDLICGSTLSLSKGTWIEGTYKLKISEISEVEKGVYSVSIVDSKGNVITDFSSIYVTFYLNKNNTNAEPQEGDIYRTVLMQNGTAIADFRNETFLKSGNVIVACFPGESAVYNINPYAKYNIPDEKNDIGTKISISNMKTYPKSGATFTAKLTDINGNPLSNKTIKFTLNGNTYTKTTDANGNAKMQISLSSQKDYAISATFEGSGNYTKSSAKATITVKKISQKIISSNKVYAPSSTNYYTITLKDGNNNPIANKKVTVKVAAKTYTKTTNKKGQIKIKIKFAKEGTYKVTIKSKATNKYTAKTKTNKIVIKKLKQKIVSSNKRFAPGDVNYYTITLKDQNNQAIAKKKVSVKVGTKTYTKKTNKKGQIKIKIKSSKKRTYKVTIKSKATKQYLAKTKTSKIIIGPIRQKISSANKEYLPNSGETYSIALKDENNKVIAGKSLKVTLNSKVYKVKTNKKGIASIKVNLKDKKVYTLKIYSPATKKYKAISKTNKISIINQTNIAKGLSNAAIQKIIDNSPKGNTLIFLGGSYSNINLNINKPLSLTSNAGTVLNGNANSPVIKISSNNVKISNLKIIANSQKGESDGILVSKANNVTIANNIITNKLGSSKSSNYYNESSTISGKSGTAILPGKGINIKSSKNVNINKNTISFFESGIYNEYSSNLNINENTIKLNSYGIKYGFGSSNTKIIKNNITDNIGLYVDDVPEGPRGYGIFLNNSAVNILISQNNICNNYIGISLDANKSTGIVITSNLISDNSLEGIRFNAGYDLAENAVEPIVTDNAIYRNAEGPSMMILGEMSANPFGIYGPGATNDSLKLKIGPNWFGVNSLITWDYDTGIVGVGTMCPRIKAEEIKFTGIELVSPGTYRINFYKNGELATNLATFDLYATLNLGSIHAVEVNFKVINGTGTFSFDKECYDSINQIRISVGPLIKVIERSYKIIYTYTVPDEEIPV